MGLPCRAMDVAWPIWILMPLIGALIGYATNWLAIRMLFRPRRPVLGFQGLELAHQPVVLG
ncbi:MAG: DUF445 domain-containing protein, partial [Planctomycetota bacterium]